MRGNRPLLEGNTFNLIILGLATMGSTFLVLKGIYHYWKYVHFIQGAKKQMEVTILISHSLDSLQLSDSRGKAKEKPKEKAKGKERPGNRVPSPKAKGHRVVGSRGLAPLVLTIGLDL